jgi:hypothetical protein
LRVTDHFVLQKMGEEDMRFINQQVDAILNDRAQNSAVVFLTIDENESLFELRDGLQTEISIPVGFKYISDRYFKHTPPTPAEIEYAINEIEDEIEKIKQCCSSDQGISQSGGLVLLIVE